MTTTYSNETKNSSSYSNQSRTSSTYTDEPKSTLLGGIEYNSTYPYNDADVTYEGAYVYASYNNQTKNTSSYSNQSKSSSSWSNQSKN